MRRATLDHKGPVPASLCALSPDTREAGLLAGDTQLQGTDASMGGTSAPTFGLAVVFVEARDPRDGAIVVLKCWTRAEAVAAVKRFRLQRLEGVKITDTNGTLVPEIDL